MTKDNLSIETEIDRIIADLAYETPGSEEYDGKVKALAALKGMQNTKRIQISGDVILASAVNLLGILLILHYEQLNALSSKAVGFVTKLRL